MRQITHEKSATGIRIRKFAHALKAGRQSLSRASQLFFLCGANQAPGQPSARRAAIKKFVEGLSSDYRVIYAESVFNELSKIGHNKNVLDLEHEISEIADKILIVLESPSAFCELGAFAHPTLRKKLIIVNDSHFQTGESFINVGPIAAAKEVKAPVLWYPMRADGVHTTDGIGRVFNDLQAALKFRATTGYSPIAIDVGKLSANKHSMYFVHDLVLFAGPATYEELIAILIDAFGDNRYDILKNLLGVLKAAGLIRSYEAAAKTWVYRSEGCMPFLRYETNTSALMAAFRNFHLRVHPNRFLHV